ncbi:hypothetical protein VPH35_053777 [Triticum aestivum]|uniref:uncharacterized protein isoform X1 n=1 Tax=Triticum aestivum TaxID=4565 RepID=UPI001D025FB0|nr:uncharacterized protein LOC123071275 isoform X1 [Triticum aestivum]
MGGAAVGPGRADVGVDAVRRRRPRCPRLIRSNLLPAPAADGVVGEGRPVLADHWRCVVLPSLCNCVVMISMRCEAHQKKYPDAKVISLGIGDTTQHIPSIFTSIMTKALPFSNFLVGLPVQVSRIIDGDMDDSCGLDKVASSHLPS